MTYPAENTQFIPSASPPTPLTIEYVREHGKIVSWHGDVATVEVHDDCVVSFCACTIDADGKIKDFVPRSNGERFCQLVREKP